jgi:hypothetical protein
LDHVNIDPETGECRWLIEAQIDLVAGTPQLVEVRLSGHPSLDPVMLQRFFRWATPIEAVRLLVPALLARGIDPFGCEFPTDGYPDVTQLERKATTTLSDEFLEEIARHYVEIGRGYAKTIARQRGVSERTVVNWIQKARRRGILSKTKPGKMTECLVARK